MDNILKSIRTDLRLSMNGAVASSMRKMGADFRMNFGVSIARIKEISLKYKADKELAEQLWSQDVRDLKIMATMLYPVDEMTIEVANRWVYDISNQEIREQTCKNLFQELPFAGELVSRWYLINDEIVRTTAYWLLTRLFIVRSDTIRDLDFEKILSRAVEDLESESLLLFQSALNVLRYFGRLSDDNATWVLKNVVSYNSSSDSRKNEMYEQLRYEFSYTDDLED